MKRLDLFRAERRHVYETLFGARALCITGLLAAPALLFNPVTELRVIQFIFFWFLSWLSGKKNNFLLTLFIVFGVICFNVIVPYGRVLFSVGAFKITYGALMGGIHRAATLEGLVMLSRIAVRRDLRFPGVLGELAGESLRVFALITDDFKRRISRKNFWEDIDALLLELSDENAEEAEPRAESRTKPAGLVVLAFVVIASWLPWLAVIFNPVKV